MIWEGASNDDMPDEHRAWGEIDLERLARMAEADNFLPGLADDARKTRRIRSLASWALAFAAGAGAGWLASNLAVALLLNESLLLAMGVGP